MPQVTAKIDEKTNSRIRNECERLGVSKSQFLNSLITKYFELSGGVLSLEDKPLADNKQATAKEE